METRPKEDPAIIQELQTANPKWSLQTGTGAWESETEWEERKLREEGTVQKRQSKITFMATRLRAFFYFHTWYVGTCYSYAFI